MARGQLEQLLLGGGRDCRRARGGAQFGEDVRHVAVDGVLAQHERFGDLSVRAALRDEAQDLLLTWTELRAHARLTTRLKHAGAALLTRRAKFKKRGSRSFELGPRCLCASQRAQRARERDARPPGLERKPCAIEQPDSILERLAGVVLAARRRVSAALGVPRRPEQRICADPVGDRAQLAACLGSLIGAPGGGVRL